MYETGEWSDLNIVTATKIFKVHKSVVCSKSRFFYDACTHGSQGLKTNTIQLEESEIVVDALLRQLYELPVAWLHERRFTANRETAEWVYCRALDAVHLMVAVEKVCFASQRLQSPLD
jgi:hypothetical protein